MTMNVSLFQSGSGDSQNHFLASRHPLFPLLALLFEKCEGCTQGSEGTTSASFDLDIETFVRRQHKEGKDFFSDDPETDSLSGLSGALSSQGIVVPASAIQQGNVAMATMAGGTVYQPVTVVTPQGQVVGQALSPANIRIQNSQLQLQLSQDLGLLHTDDGSGKNKRGVLPKQATNVMRSWLFQHIG
ncbi:hypothetical protein AB205_0153220, partial [Aquarana catesbeiana]